MKTIFKKLHLVLVLFVFFNTMNAATFLHENDLSGIPFSQEERSSKKINDIRQNFAKTLARAMNSYDVRAFLKQEASKQFDGDFSILYAVSKNKMVNKNQTFADVLTEYAGKSLKQKDYFSKYVSDNDPLLNILIPELENASVLKWDARSQIPKVVFVEDKFNSKDRSTINGYDAKEKSVIMSSVKEPENLTVVIGANERVIAINKMTNKDHKGNRISIDKNAKLIGDSDSKFIYYGVPITNIDPDEGGGCRPSSYKWPRCYCKDIYPVGSRGFDNCMCEMGEEQYCDDDDDHDDCICERDCKNTKDELYKFKFNSKADLNYAEGWLGGRVEMRVTIFFAENGSSSEELSFIDKQYSIRRRDLKDGSTMLWKILNLDVVTWDPLVYGDRMKYKFTEVDDQSWSISTKVGLKPKFKVFGQEITLDLSVEFKYSPKDEPCGESIVEYCDKADSPGELYNTGTLSFYVRHRN